ncbi:magnesium transporter [Citricoccus nitrophenolicus]|uniref:Magnesium transporter MgtE n=1 Tax=Citricoccus muralis TaxID=169134 RepID=A0A3D9LHD2_9MICC|nr:magnesium transporter [Citricoccus muralis]REE05210.1 Mg2+ transporter MgtE [Citricoccus muralis]
MTPKGQPGPETQISGDLRRGDVEAATDRLRRMSPAQVRRVLGRSGAGDVAVIFRLLEKNVAVAVFASLEPRQQSQLITALQDEDVQVMFAHLQASGQARLLDEVPAEVAQRLLGTLNSGQREDAGRVLGYPHGSVGRRMGPVLIELRPGMTAGEALQSLRESDVPEQRLRRLVSLPVVGRAHRLLGMVELTVLASAPEHARVADLMTTDVDSVAATEDDETAARRLAAEDLLALPVIDVASRLVGVLTLADASRILAEEETEDAARSGGSEPLAQPYLSTSVGRLVRSRMVWLLVLAVGATLTVQVLEVFESTLEEMVVLSVFVPLLIGTGGNTGNQAATTVTRALALGDVRSGDALRVVRREFAVGLGLGAMLGTIGLVVAGLVYAWPIGVVIGLTLLSICTLAASVGSLMPIIARQIGVDPAVFSNPFISTVVDALGLIVYFLIAQAVLGI